MYLKTSSLRPSPEVYRKDNGRDGPRSEDPKARYEDPKARYEDPKARYKDPKARYEDPKASFCGDVEVVDRDLVAVTMDTVRQASEHGDDETLAVLDLSDVVHKYVWWMRHLPEVRPHYAVKANDDPAVLQTLATLGANFDCASKGEIEKVLRLGVSPDRIIFANTVKFRSHLRYAASIGVHHMTFDNENELYKIKSTCPNARLVLRIQPFEFQAIQWKLHGKFGCHHENEAPTLLRLARMLNLHVIGVSFHVGSGCRDPEPYVESIHYARHVFDVAAKQGLRLHLVDIGGGFFGGAQSCQYFSKMSRPIQEALRQNFPPESGVTYIAEPGRYFVESAVTIAACVTGKRVVPSGTGRPKAVAPAVSEDGILKTNLGTKDAGDAHFEYYLSDGVYGCLRDMPYLEEVALTIYPVVPFTAPVYNSTLWGPTCDSIDCLQKLLPLAELEEGDWVIFQHMGAYTTVFRTDFNGIAKPHFRRVILKDVYDALLACS